MIQRKQSLWLFIAALLNAGVLYFDIYKYNIAIPKPLLTEQVMVSTPQTIKVADHFPSLLIALVMILLPLVTIFMYKKRKQQVAMAFVSILAVLSFMTMSLKRVNHVSTLTPAPTNESYWIGAILPVVALVFLVLAIIGIRKDDKLVKSADRLR